MPHRAKLIECFLLQALMLDDEFLPVTVFDFGERLLVLRGADQMQLVRLADYRRSR